MRGCNAAGDASGTTVFSDMSFLSFSSRQAIGDDVWHGSGDIGDVVSLVLEYLS